MLGREGGGVEPRAAAFRQPGSVKTGDHFKAVDVADALAPCGTAFFARCGSIGV